MKSFMSPGQARNKPPIEEGSMCSENELPERNLMWKCSSVEFGKSARRIAGNYGIGNKNN